MVIFEEGSPRVPRGARTWSTDTVDEATPDKPGATTRGIFQVWTSWQGAEARAGLLRTAFFAGSSFVSVVSVVPVVSVVFVGSVVVAHSHPTQPRPGFINSDRAARERPSLCPRPRRPTAPETPLLSPRGLAAAPPVSTTSIHTSTPSSPPSSTAPRHRQARRRNLHTDLRQAQALDHHQRPKPPPRARRTLAIGCTRITSDRLDHAGQGARGGGGGKGATVVPPGPRSTHLAGAALIDVHVTKVDRVDVREREKLLHHDAAAAFFFFFYFYFVSTSPYSALAARRPAAGPLGPQEQLRVDLRRSDRIAVRISAGATLGRHRSLASSRGRWLETPTLPG